jgi:mannose-6-phosphate isomerase
MSSDLTSALSTDLTTDLTTDLSVTADAVSVRPAATELTHTPVDDIFVAERPWGAFQQFVQNRPVTVKIITVQPGHRLSLQRHGHRDEMWHILDVPIYVEVGDESRVVQVGDHVWVPAGSVHRMTNQSDRPGRLLEVAFGDFDESDIERLEDDYARAAEDARRSVGSAG